MRWTPNLESKIFLYRLTPHASLASRLFDHPVRTVQHRLWNREPDLLRRFQIDNQLELGWLFYRQVSGFGTFENPVHVVCGAPETFSIAVGVGHEATGLYKLTCLVH